MKKYIYVSDDVYEYIINIMAKLKENNKNVTYNDAIKYIIELYEKINDIILYRCGIYNEII